MQEPTAMPVSDAVPTDGRTLRSLRTREAIVDATISLLEDGDLRPTAPRVAERAKVSVRSVFQHFEDLERLHTSVAERLVERVAVLLVPVPSDLPLEERLARFVSQRTQLLEAVTPIRRAAAVHAPFSQHITKALRDGQLFLRDEVARTFAPEIEAAGDDGQGLLDAVDVALGWGAWETLRTSPGRTHQEAEQVILRLARSALTS